jgi:6-phosphogluconolactonase (cycloisomerase 2 family)
VVFSPYGAALILQTGPAGGSNASSISSYLVEDDGTLAPITASVPTLGSAACWVELTPNGQFAFTANSASSSLSAFAIDSSGDVSAVAGTVVASLPAGTTDIDIAISQDGKYLYTLNTGTGTVGVLEIIANGTLTPFRMTAGLKAQAGFNGIAAF